MDMTLEQATGYSLGALLTLIPGVITAFCETHPHPELEDLLTDYLAATDALQAALHSAMTQDPA